MKKILITGASGFLGYHLLKEAYGKYEVYGLTHQNSCSFDCKLSIPCDITNYIELGNLIDDIEPDLIIHAAALADLGFCEANREKSYSVNVEATANLAGIASDLRVPFVFTSTDMVFDGKQGMYSEEDAVNPLNIYGEHKAIAEQKVLSLYPESLIVRLPLMFGHSMAAGNNFMSKFVAQIKSGEAVKLFTDEYRSVCGAFSIAKGIFELEGKANGIIHLAGQEKLSRYDLGLKAAEVLQLDKSLAIPSLQSEVSFPYKRPKDVSINITKALKLGFSPMKTEDELSFALH
jgi:dTDP-4-dehydrorhamnose reductase